MTSLIDSIRKVPDFPKEGILFYDLTTAFQDPVEFGNIIEAMCEPFQRQKIASVCAIEARGFILGSAIANELGAGFVPIRKAGRLPAPTHQQSYTLEYGENTLEIHQDAIQSGQKVLLVDDLLATGGTAQASVKLIEQCGGEIAGISFVMELKELAGREKLAGQSVHTLLTV
jgi:adenine phosphoribosyltransferase